MRKLLVVLLAALFAGCSSGSGSSTGGIVGHGDAGADAGPPAFDITDLPVSSKGPGQRVAAALASDGRIGVVSYATLDAQHRKVEYLEVAPDGSTRSATLAASVQRVSQLAVAFDDQGRAVVAFFGNDPNYTESIKQNPGDGGYFWTESDLAVAVITSSGAAAAVEYPVHGYPDDAQTGLAIDMNSVVVGESPSIALNGSELVVLHRNLHSGQFPVQDYGKSNLEAVVGMPGAFTPQVAIEGTDQGGNFVTTGAGEGSAVASLNGLTVAVCAGQSDIDAKLENLYAVSRTGTGAQAVWGNKEQLFRSLAITGDLDTGPRIAADATAGFGLSWLDKSHGVLHYATSRDGVSWGGLEDVFGAGTGGLYQSLAFDPSLHEPGVAFYVCSKSPGANACPTDEQELRVAFRRGGTWRQSTVDASGGIYPTLLFNGGQALVVYRDLVSGGIRLARQRAP